MKSIDGSTTLSGVRAPIGSELALPKLQSPPSTAGSQFEKQLGQAVQEVGALEQQAVAQNERLATGQSGALHENMIALEKANIGLRMMVTVRNKVLDAYRELTQMS